MTIPAHLRPAYDKAIAKGLSHADALDCLSLADNALSPAPSSAAQVLASLAPSAAPPAASPAQPQAFAGWTRDAAGRVHRPDGAAASLTEALDFARAERGHAPRAQAQTAQPQPQPQRRQPTDAERRQARLLQIRSGSLRMDAPDAGSSYALRPKSDAVRDALTAHFNEGVSLSDACARFGVSLPPDPAR